MSGIINALLLVGVLFAGVYVFQHKDELLSQLNLSGGGGASSATDAAPPEAAAAAPAAASADDGDSAPAASSKSAVPEYDESKEKKEGKATTKPADKKTSDKTGSTKVKTSSDHKCKKGEKYDSKKKKCVKVNKKKKKSHFAYSYYVMPTYSFTNFAASPRISL